MNLRAANHDRRRWQTFSQQRCGKDGPNARTRLTSLRLGKFGFDHCHKIVDMDCLPVNYCSADSELAVNGALKPAEA